MTTPSDLVAEFHRTFGLAIRTEPVAQPPEFAARLDLMREELAEYLKAVTLNDPIAVADALADMVYVITGSALVHGIDLDACIAEVHRSNMSKLGADGVPVLRDDGKVLKGPSYTRPDLVKVMSQGRTPSPEDPT